MGSHPDRVPACEQELLAQPGQWRRIQFQTVGCELCITNERIWTLRTAIVVGIIAIRAQTTTEQRVLVRVLLPVCLGGWIGWLSVSQRTIESSLHKCWLFSIPSPYVGSRVGSSLPNADRRKVHTLFPLGCVPTPVAMSSSVLVAVDIYSADKEAGRGDNWFAYLNCVAHYNGGRIIALSITIRSCVAAQLAIPTSKSSRYLVQSPLAAREMEWP